MTQDSTIRLWNTQTSKCVKTYKGHTNGIYCLFACFSVTGRKTVVSGSEDSKVYVWDLQTREVLQVLEGHRGISYCLQPVPLVLRTDPSRPDVVMAVAVSPFVSRKTMTDHQSCLPDPPNEEHNSIRGDGKRLDDTTLVRRTGIGDPLILPFLSPSYPV